MKSIFLALTLFAASLAPVHAQRVADERAASVDPVAGDPGARAVNGWLKSFSTGAIAAGDSFEAPDYQGSLIEQAARDTVVEQLAARGFVPADGTSANLLTISISVKAPKPKGAKPLPKSPVQIASQDRNPFDNIYDPELRPEITFNNAEKTRPTEPELSVTIYAHRSGERVWSGYAGARLGGASREAVAQSLAAALIDHFGESVDLGAAEFIIRSDAATPVDVK